MNAPDKQDLLNQAAGKALPATEATQVEMQRAIAQVQGALLVARANPRDEKNARERIKKACEVHELASAAFFLFNRGGSQVTGPSIKLAKELARCWGNIDYGIVELRRNDDKGESEMLAVAWDLETNTRSSNSFVVPHKRDTKSGATVLKDMRDIYENNANAAARRLRECILSVIPHEILEESKAACRATIEHGKGVALPVRRTQCEEAFAGIHITRAQVEKKIGRSLDIATAPDLAALEIVYLSIKNNETTADEHFDDDSTPEIESQLKANKAVDAHPSSSEATAKLLSQARDIATLGIIALERHWKTFDKAQQQIVDKIKPELKKTAEAADNAAVDAEDKEHPADTGATDDERMAV